MQARSSCLDSVNKATLQRLRGRATDCSLMSRKYVTTSSYYVNMRHNTRSTFRDNKPSKEHVTKQCMLAFLQCNARRPIQALAIVRQARQHILASIRHALHNSKRRANKYLQIDIVQHKPHDSSSTTCCIQCRCHCETGAGISRHLPHPPNTMNRKWMLLYNDKSTRYLGNQGCKEAYLVTRCICWTGAL